MYTCWLDIGRVSRKYKIPTALYAQKASEACTKWVWDIKLYNTYMITMCKYVRHYSYNRHYSYTINQNVDNAWCFSLVNYSTSLKHRYQYTVYRRDMYETLNRMSSRIVQVAAASGLAEEFLVVLQLKIKNSTSSVYSRLHGTLPNPAVILNYSLFSGWNPFTDPPLSRYLNHGSKRGW